MVHLMNALVICTYFLFISAGFLSTLGDVRENDPVHPMSFAPTPNSGRSSSGWPPGGDRWGRSTSLTGQHVSQQVAGDILTS